MTVTLTSEAVGKLPGETYTGPEEAWLLAEGYAKKTGYGDPTPAVLTGGSNAVNIVTGGDLVFNYGHKTYTVALATADTPAQVATKVDTALATAADAAITGGKLVVTSVKPGSSVVLGVTSGTGTVLANLGLTAGQSAKGGDGGVGTANTGPTDVTPANDPTLAANREAAPKRDPLTAIPDPGPLDPAMTYSTADDDPNDKDLDYDMDPGGVDNDPSVVSTVTPGTGGIAGGTALVIKGTGFKRATGVTVGGVAATAFSVVSDTEVHATTGAHAAGAVPVIVLDADGNGTKANGFTYA